MPTYYQSTFPSSWKDIIQNMLNLSFEKNGFQLVQRTHFLDTDIYEFKRKEEEILSVKFQKDEVKGDTTLSIESEGLIEGVQDILENAIYQSLEVLIRSLLPENTELKRKIFLRLKALCEELEDE